LVNQKKTRISLPLSGHFVARSSQFPNIAHIIQEPTSRFAGLDLRLTEARNLWLAGYDILVVVAADSVALCMINHAVGVSNVSRHPRL
jgi:hypothetical protein